MELTPGPHGEPMHATADCAHCRAYNARLLPAQKRQIRFARLGSDIVEAKLGRRLGDRVFAWLLNSALVLWVCA